MDKTTKAFVLASAAVVIASGVPLGINAWKNLLTDKRPYAEGVEDCRSARLKRWSETFAASERPAADAEVALDKVWDEIRAECRAKVAP